MGRRTNGTYVVLFRERKETTSRLERVWGMTWISGLRLGRNNVALFYGVGLMETSAVHGLFVDAFVEQVLVGWWNVSDRVE